MTLQSIWQTPVPKDEADDSGSPDLPEQRMQPGSSYYETWPESRLIIRGPAPSDIAEVIGLVDSGVPSGNSVTSAGRPARARLPRRTVIPGSDRDDDGHATFLARTIHGRKGRDAHIKVDPIKAFSAQGWPTADDGARAIEKVASAGARVILLAWDVGYTTELLKEQIYAVRDQAVVVIAAGNWSMDNDTHPNWPANYGGEDGMRHVITVMATDDHDERASYSSYGAKSVDVAAPGTSIVESPTTSSTLRNAGSLRNGYSVFRGTSAAAGHVARLAALVRAKNRALSPEEVKKHICETAREVDALKKKYYHKGRLVDYCHKGRLVNFSNALK